ncbi:hypothetical protein [Streptomyces sp. ST1015]|uniref:hypothetical protein n=1 Tax=Streptomyces sp. ST1015 TaxID=1848900 RepID=UPI00223BF9D5|nr:hypothetical protein [Streptomyces sp. ST1015]
MGTSARARTAALAAVVAGVLVTGATTADGEPARAAAPGTGTTASTVTLITGDRVAVGADGRVASLVRAQGREKVGFSVRRERGHTWVVPQDALRLIADGVLDRRLFDVTRLAGDGYGDALPLIVGYREDSTLSTARSGARDPFAGVPVRERRALPAVNGEAFAVPGSGTPALWSAVTGRASPVRRTARPAPYGPWPMSGWTPGSGPLSPRASRTSARRPCGSPATRARASRWRSWTRGWTRPTRTSRASRSRRRTSAAPRT